nr:MAG TPA: hypothetical protein [Caudoviricetes sp.]
MILKCSIFPGRINYISVFNTLNSFFSSSPSTK